MAEGLYYFTDIWNILDMSGYFTFFLHTVLYMSGSITHGSMTFKSILSLAILLLWLRAIGDLRAFKNTRYLVRLVIETVRDLKSFMILLVVMLYTYSVVQYIVKEDQDLDNIDYGDEEFKSSWLIGFGVWDTSTFTTL